MKELSNFEFIIKFIMIFIIIMGYTILLSQISLFFALINPVIFIMAFYFMNSLEKNAMNLRGELK